MHLQIGHPLEFFLSPLEDWDRGISIGGRMITNLRYADKTTVRIYFFYTSANINVSIIYRMKYTYTYYSTIYIQY